MKKGFTLLELVVMVAVIAIIMTIIMAIMTNTFKANNRTMALQKINDNGSYALEQIRRYYLSQSICDGTALTIDANKVLKLNDSELTKKDEVKASDLNVNCDDKVLSVSFKLETGSDKGKEYQASKSFTTSVVLRN